MSNKALNELNENIDQIVFLLKTNSKIMKRHKDWLGDILAMVIDARELSEKDFEVFKVMKKIDTEHLLKTPAFDSLNHEYVRLSDWLRENQGLQLPSKDKARIVAIQKRINSFPEYSDEEVSKMSDSSVER